MTCWCVDMCRVGVLVVGVGWCVVLGCLTVVVVDCLVSFFTFDWCDCVALLGV